MEKNNVLNFEVVVAIIEKAMNLGYSILCEDFSHKISVKKDDSTWIQFNISFKATEEDDITLHCTTSNFGNTKIKISRKELAIFNLLLEKVREYNEVQLVKIINDFFPKVEEKKSVTTIDDLDDEND